MPSHLVGVPTGERLTYSTVELEISSFLRLTLSPWLARIEQAIANDPDLSPATQGCRFEVDGLLRADTATRAAYYTAALNPDTGWLTRDEVRGMESMPLEGQANG